MKKNILTIIIMAISLINTVLIAMIIFTIVPTANRTNQLVSKVASIVDLELESPNANDNISVEDIQSFNVTDTEPMKVSLASNDGSDHFLTVNVSLSMNKKNKDFAKLSPTITDNVDAIKEIVGNAFSQYTKEEVKTNKEKIKQQIITNLKNYFHSDFIINVTFVNLLIE